MRRLTILLTMLLVGSFGLVASSIGAEDNVTQPAAEDSLMTQMVNLLRKAEADPNATADPNAADAKPKEFQDLDKTLKSIDRDSREEMREWMKNNDENRIDLAKAVQKQVEAELNLIRKLAAAEGCGGTTVAIDRLLALRLARFTKLIEDMEKTTTRRSRRTEQTESEPRIDPLRRSRGRDSELRNMSSEERREAWEQRRREERDRRIQERQGKKSQTPQDNMNE